MSEKKIYSIFNNEYINISAPERAFIFELYGIAIQRGRKKTILDLKMVFPQISDNYKHNQGKIKKNEKFGVNILSVELGQGTE